MLRGLFACLVMSALGIGTASAESITFFGASGGGTFITDLATDGSQAFLVDADIGFVQNTSTSLAVAGSCGTFGCLNLITGALDQSLTTTTVTGGTNFVFGSTGPGSGLFITGDVGSGATTLFFAPFVGPINLDLEQNPDLSFTGVFSAAVAGGVLDGALASALSVDTATLPGGGFDIIVNFTQDAASGLFHGEAAFNEYQVAATPVPEPASLFLLGAGMVGLARNRITHRHRQF